MRNKVINKENEGAWSARNRGIDAAKGKYIMFLDCDDWYEVTLLQEMYECIENNNVDLVICGQINVLVNQKNDIIRYSKVLPEPHYYKTNDEILNDYIYLRKKNIGDVLWNKIYKLNIIRRFDLKFQSLKRGEDTVFNANYYEKINKCMVLNKALYYYRIEATNPVWLKYSNNYYNLLKEENETIVNKLKQWGKYDDNAKLYQSFHFINGIIRYFNWIVYPKNNFTFSEKYSKVIEILNKDKVKECLKKINGETIYHKLIIKCMELKSVVLILFLVRLKNLIKNLINKIKY